MLWRDEPALKASGYRFLESRWEPDGYWDRMIHGGPVRGLLRFTAAVLMRGQGSSSGTLFATFVRIDDAAAVLDVRSSA